MDRIWIKNYPAGVPAEIDAAQYPSLVALFEESFAKYKNANAYACMDKKLTYGQLDEMSRALGAWLQSKGLAARRPRRHHDAERAAVSGVRGRHPARRLRGGERQPALHAARARAPAQGFRRQGHHHHRELRQDAGAGAGARRPSSTSCWPAWATCWASPRAAIVNLVVRKVKKMVPAFSLPGATKFNDAIAPAGACSSPSPTIKRDDVAFLQYTGGTTGVSKGATLLHRNVIANVLQNEAWLQPALKKGKQVEQHDDRHRAAALPHLRADRVLPARHAHRRHVPAHPQPARHPGLRQGAGEVRVQHAARRQHALQRAAQQPRVRQARLQRAEGCQRRRHGRAAGGGGALLQAHRLSHHRGLRPVGDLADADLQPRRQQRVHRHHRPAGAVHRDLDPRRRRQGGAARRARRDLRARPPGDGRLLAAARGDRQGHDAPTASSRPATSA